MNDRQYTGPTTDQLLTGCLYLFLAVLVMIAVCWADYQYRKQIVKDAIRETMKGQP